MRNPRFIYDRFATLSPSTSAKLAFTFIAVSIVLLGITLIPIVFIYETEFTNAVSIGDFQGVTRISWGTWRACYGNAVKNICTNEEFVDNPYTFIIENGNQVQATVQKMWLRVLFLQLVGLFFTVFIVAVIFLRYRFLIRKAKRNNATGGLDSKKKERICNLTNILMALLWVWITIVVIGNIAVLMSIRNEMGTLGTEVTTNPAPGFYLPVAADVFILLTAIAVVFIKLKYREEEVEFQYSQVQVRPKGSSSRAYY